MVFFKKFYQLEMEICAKEARRLKSKIEDRIQKTDEEDE